jgi:hypothetical protein
MIRTIIFLLLFCDLFVDDISQMSFRDVSYNDFTGNPPTECQQANVYVAHSKIFHSLTLPCMVLTYLACYNCRNMVSSFSVTNDSS